MWLLPTFARPQNLRRFFDAYRATGGSTPGLVLVDAADPCLEEYLRIALPVTWRIQVTNGRTQGDKIRNIWPDIRTCSWLGLIGDDNVPETPGWDRALTGALDGWNIVSCNDGWQAPKRLGNCWVMGGHLVRAAGGIFPGNLHHLFVDDVWETIGREAACWTCLMDVMVKHAHVHKGEAPVDETHRAVYGESVSKEEGLWPSDRAAFEAWKAEEHDRVIKLVRENRDAENLAPVRNTVEIARPVDGAAVVSARMERAKSRSVMICTPIARHPTYQYTGSLAATIIFLQEHGIRCSFQFLVGSSVVAKARNELVAHFLLSNCTDLLFVDDDMQWSPNSVLRLLASDKALIGGVGRMRAQKPNCDPDVWCWRPLRKGKQLTQDEMGAIEVLGFGAAFMLINRRVFIDMIAAHPEWKKPGAEDWPKELRANYYEFFRQNHEGETGETSEDYVFCDRWRKLGNSAWIDPTIRLGHVGSWTFSGAVEELLVPEPLSVVKDAA